MKIHLVATQFAEGIDSKEKQKMNKKIKTVN